MTNEEKIAALLAMHNPAAVENGHVYEVWTDGEVTSTKGADLYGQRTLHTMIPSLANKADHLEPDSLHPRFKYSRIMVNTYDEAEAARKIIGSDYMTR